MSSSSLSIPPNQASLPVTMVDDWIVIFHTDRAHTCPQFFNKSWIEYRDGFGDCLAGKFLGECYLGNENIYQLTASGNYALRIQIFKTSYQHALILEYDSFSIADESNKYRLSVSGFRNVSELYPNIVGDCLNRASYQGDGEKFSTPDPDQDNDVWFGHCARNLGVGWWESHCGSCALTDRCTWGKHNVTGKYVFGDECLMMIKKKV